MAIKDLAHGVKLLASSRYLARRLARMRRSLAPMVEAEAVLRMMVASVSPRREG